MQLRQTFRVSLFSATRVIYCQNIELKYNVRLIRVFLGANQLPTEIQ